MLLAINIAISTLCVLVLTKISATGTCYVEKAFKMHGIVPDVLPASPQNFLRVTYEGHIEVRLGNELTPTQVQYAPSLYWRACYDAYYTLVMIDPDVPRRTIHTMRSVRHWIVGNIPRNKLNCGEILVAYVGAGPGLNTGLHRYVFLLYKQPGRLNFTEPYIASNNNVGRPNFNITQFAEKYGLKEPLFGNFFLAQWNEHTTFEQK